MIKVQNLWTYGEVGDRLDGVRNSEIYAQGARSIENMIITDVGSLKVAKQYDRKGLISGQTIIDVRTTSLGYYLVLTNTHIHSINETNDSITQSIAHGMGANVGMNLLGNDRLLVFDGVNTFKPYKLESSTITPEVDTFKKMKYPIKKREILQLDLWKVSKNPYYTGNPDKDAPGTKPLRIIQMSAFSDPLIKTSGGVIYLHNSEIVINRIYTSYNAAVDIEYFTEPKEGEIYGIMRTLPKKDEAPNSDFIVDNTIVTLGALTSDAAYRGSYITSITGNGEGVFTFGELISTVMTPQHMNFYQDRLFMYKDGYFYVSKIGEYSDLRNATNSDAAFFFQLNPIAGKAGELVDTVADIGLFILTSSGVYIVGYGGTQLTPTTFGSSIVVASDVGTTKQYTIKDNALYFLNRQGVLKAVFIDRLSQQVAFNTVTVDKYTNKKLFNTVSKLTIDDRDYVVCRSTDNQHIYIIEPIEATGIFRKIKIALDTTGVSKVIGIDEKILLDGDILNVSNRNYAEATINVLPPDMSSEAGGMFLFDNSSNIKSIILKVLNENREGVNGVYIDNKPITNLPPTVNDNFSIWKLITSRRVNDGFNIRILTNQNDKSVEIQGIETILDVFKDK